MFTPLNLPNAPLKITEKNEKRFVTCLLRKKPVVLTPEEWVRQHLIHYLVSHKSLALGRLAVEVNVRVNSLSKRADIVYYDETLQPELVVECKAPEVKLTSETVFQLATYNSQLDSKFLIISNGLDHFIFENKKGTLVPLDDLPC
ncbi:MAG: type I restriction enzyme HsdR N-terminal domain-containing protein [Bacteroidetes bacterium]|nr:type I restriction enzyme HsdR N-terminal domain-containing protein [Bacteroidota bacterium]